MLNPITSNKSYLINYSAVWTIIIGAHFAVLHWYYHISLGVALLDSFLFNVFFAFLGISLWYVVRYNKSSQKFITLFSSHLVSSLIIIGFWLVSGYLILKYSVDDLVYLSFLEGSFPWRIISGIFYYLVFILVYYVVVFYQENQQKIKEEANLKTLIKEVELNALKNQINPHFLFNSLNSISSLTISSPDKAQEMIIKLSEYLRYSLSNENEQVTTLAREIANIKLYLEIEKIRFGNRLNFELNCNKECLNAKLPAMILQPLFENAIKHGVYESIDTINVILDGRKKDDELELVLTNNFDATARQVKGEGIGLKNTQERLFLIYRRRDLLVTEKIQDTFMVTIKIPQDEKN
ncbi:histidine kinase [Vicingus serpentipes]|uniref:Histidine kinase n=1 Tax=Vicingus serpentipes TaxID=1926625 RepID=A0A5C6RPX1_9FLAO|nr:histidine kinase [Vicingus serpentipes]TXB64015.1 histidine kinase [Vicingus serpentipes]